MCTASGAVAELGVPANCLRGSIDSDTMLPGSYDLVGNVNTTDRFAERCEKLFQSDTESLAWKAGCLTSHIKLIVEVSDTTYAFDRDVKGPLYARAQSKRYRIVEVW